MTEDEAKWFIDRCCAVAHRDGRSVLYPVHQAGDTLYVEVDAQDDFSALQILDDPRPLTVRHTGLAELLKVHRYHSRLSMPILWQQPWPQIRRGKWGGVLLFREQYPRKPEPEMTRSEAKKIMFAQAYGGLGQPNRNGDLFVGIDWATVVGIPPELMHGEPRRAVCRFNWQPQR